MFVLAKLLALNKPRFTKRDSKWHILKGGKNPKQKLSTPKENRRPKSPKTGTKSGSTAKD